jgi:N-acetylmuramoyl-L-alanine amidase
MSGRTTPSLIRRPRPIRAGLPLALVLALAVSAPLAASVGAETLASAQSHRGLTDQTQTVGLPLAGIVIAIDPGHNGGNAAHPARIARRVSIGNGRKACNTVGTTTRGGYPEHRLAFSVALQLKTRLETLGATVLLSRTNDTGVGPCVDVRGRFGAKVHAALTVSIHADGSAVAHRGFVVMKPGRVPGYTTDILAASSQLALAMRAGLLATGLPIANYYAPHGIVSRTDLGTLNLSDVPVVMVELGNMKNASDAARMTRATGRAGYAAGLLAGIRRYLGL